MTLNARFILKGALRTARLTYTYVVAFGFDHTHISQRRGSGLEGLAPLPPCGQLTRCSSAVAELLVVVLVKNAVPSNAWRKSTRFNVWLSRFKWHNMVKCAWL